MTSIPLLVSSPNPCSYLEGEQAQSAFVSPVFKLNTRIYSHLIAHGFRRSGDDVYSPHCGHCSQCISSRIKTLEFKANRRQKRCYKKNSETVAVIKPAQFEEQHYDLYMRYQKHKHPDSGMADSSPDDYISFLSSSWCQTQFVEFHIEKQLAAVAVVDFLDNALSAVYTFFDPEFSHYSLGTYAVLWQIETAKQRGLDWVYLGYWIADCQKMAYKNQYQPLQGFVNQHWVSLQAE